MNSKDKIVISCKLCLMTNQKPFSVNETKNKSSNQKNLLYNLEMTGFVLPVKV